MIRYVAQGDIRLPMRLARQRQHHANVAPQRLPLRLIDGHGEAQLQWVDTRRLLEGG